MITAVDSSVLLDVLCNDPEFCDRSAAALRRAMEEGRVILSEPVVAEIGPTLKEHALREFLADWRMELVGGTLETAILAGRSFSAYLGRGGRRGRVVTDFLIGAHAALLADRLLARDRGYFRDYFRGLVVMEP